MEFQPLSLAGIIQLFYSRGYIIKFLLVSPRNLSKIILVFVHYLFYPTMYKKHELFDRSIKNLNLYKTRVWVFIFRIQIEALTSITNVNNCEKRKMMKILSAIY